MVLLCDDCKKENPEQFMAKEAVWKSIARDSEFLCLDCFQKRLGRNLNSDDFPWGNPCNIINDRVRVICGFKALSDLEKQEFEEFLMKKGF